MIRKIKSVVYLLIIVFILPGYSMAISNDTHSKEFDFFNIIPINKESYLTKDVLVDELERQKIKYKEIENVRDPNVSTGIFIEKLTERISNVIFGFDYKKNLLIIEYDYMHEATSDDETFESIIKILKDYYGLPYHQKLDYLENTYRITWWDEEKSIWTIHLIRIRRQENTFIVHLKYSCWPYKKDKQY